jgi:nicotinate-nucleotide pyrophosphorylase (carboxylating)
VIDLLPTDYMRELLRRCLDEDGGLHGDVTTSSMMLSDAQGCFAIHVRGCGTVAGLNPIADSIGVFGELTMELKHQDGDQVQDEQIAILEGSMPAILVAERTILNILGHTSGIASLTRQFVDAIASTECVVCDTRKTTPGLRLLDKYAVTCGGGTLHRLGLHDAVLYKDNHLASLHDFPEQLGAAIANAKTHQDLKCIEVEVDTLEQLEKVLLLPVDMILLDNMTNEQLSLAVSLRNESDSSPLLEASGGVSLETIRLIAETGVDRIAVGALTHRAPWLDIGLDIIDA